MEQTPTRIRESPYRSSRRWLTDPTLTKHFRLTSAELRARARGAGLLHGPHGKRSRAHQVSSVAQATLSDALVSHPREGDEASLMTLTTHTLAAVLEASEKPLCSAQFLTDGSLSSYSLFQLKHRLPAPRGVGVFEVTRSDLEDNTTEAKASSVIAEARKMRELSWCVNVVVLSDDPAFLASFAESSLRGRLLVWATRLLVVTRLPLQELRRLLASSWTFSMMNAMVINLEERSGQFRYRIYTHQPYNTPEGKLVHLATWAPEYGLYVKSGQRLFPEKFENFRGAEVGVTALPFQPYWIEEETTGQDGALRKTYTGSDGLLLRTIAEGLNFTFTPLPVSTWGEVTQRVVERRALMAVVHHVLLPQRKERYDYTYTYEQILFDFCMARPSLTPQWQSLYYPLADAVWACILAAVLFMAVVLYMARKNKKFSPWNVTEITLGSLLGQSVPLDRDTNGFRVSVASWLVFAFVVGTAYRGNLTAALTLPKYPDRPETIEQLVKAVDSVTMPSYGTEFQAFFLRSNSEVFRTLGGLMEIVPSAMDGLNGVATKRQSFMDGRRYLEHMIAEHFTDARGEAQLYVGRQSVLPGLAGWPVPHDAPYKPQLDRLMMRILEAGLYEKWSEDMLRRARAEARRRQKRKLQELRLDEEDVEAEESTRKTKPLTVVHLQGPLILLLLGLLLGGAVFVLEAFVSRL
ncbi:Variant Ionotropic Glutamate Receptor [Penaeus vannamei]|uniref:Variant Ionotropic Glutamate Receptor n=1 Tax=Penaeus vannamei TaxID=6689 RepID=A0A3R7PWH5_PENVA|nr:Variant Ionotropic Glutamate Receptor [Penaeus vannamei]